MQREAQQVRRPRNTQGANVQQRQRQRQVDQRASGPSRDRWTDPENRVFLQEWEVVEQEVGHPGGKIHKKTRLICQRLGQRGLRKSWTSCFNLLLTMQSLHEALCNERPGVEPPLFSPYAEALYRILGPRDPRSQVPETPYDGAGNLQSPIYPQPPMAFLPPEYHPWSLGIPAPSGEPEWNPPLMMSREESLVPRWDPWGPHYLMAPPLHPASVPADTSLQPWVLSLAEVSTALGPHSRLWCAHQNTADPCSQIGGTKEAQEPKMQREAQQVRKPRNTHGANVQQRQRQEDQRASAGLSHDRWTDPEIRVFLQEWEDVEQEVGHPGGKIHKKTRLICQRLGQMGLKKSWTSCFNLLLTMHKTLRNERPGTQPLFSPYAEALYRILGPRDLRSQVPSERLLDRLLRSSREWHQLACPS